MLIVFLVFNIFPEGFSNGSWSNGPEANLLAGTGFLLEVGLLVGTGFPSKVNLLPGASLLPDVVLLVFIHKTFIYSFEKQKEIRRNE